MILLYWRPAPRHTRLPEGSSTIRTRRRASCPCADQRVRFKAKHLSVASIEYRAVRPSSLISSLREPTEFNFKIAVEGLCLNRTVRNS